MRRLGGHWPEYLMEAAELGLFMLVVCLVCTLLEHPDSPARQALPNAVVRRALMGLAMGLTAIGLIYSPWGKQSGAHMNPAVTITFLRLGKVHPWDAFYYIVAQFAGGLAGVLLSALLLGPRLAHPSIDYAPTVPGPDGPWVALAAEVAIAFGMMLTVLCTCDRPALRRFTGVFAGILVGLYVLVESPISGFGMNPARTCASAVPSHVWTACWIYFLAPPLGMLLAAQVVLLARKPHEVPCAKVHHHNATRCIHCGKETSPWPTATT